MRAVSGALGTTAGSLYRYLASRDDLLDLMVDAVLAELPLGRESRRRLARRSAWRSRTQQLVLYRRHPWLLAAAPWRNALGPNATNYFEDCLRIMDPLPCGTSRKLEAIAMMTGLVSLFARASPDATAPAVNPFGNATPDAHPHLIAALSKAAASEAAPDLFHRTLRAVLSGLVVDAR